jgi:hypothetical protein
MQTATFFITTARSGTQWLYAALQAAYSDLLAVEHEPIRYAYAPKRCLRNPAALAALRVEPVVRQHLDRIHEVLRHKSYVEVGFPAFAAAPLLAEEFGTRLRLVQLVRHPVRVAASVVTHQWFDPGQRDDIQADIAPTPTDSGVRLKHYRDQWAHMSPFEKALFYWGEVHLYGLEVRDQLPAVPFLQLTFEDLVAQHAAHQRLVAFLDVPYRPAWSAAPARRVDKYRWITAHTIDFSDVYKHPEIVALAERFGYDVGDIQKRSFMMRYRGSWIKRTLRQLKHALVHRIVPGGHNASRISRRGSAHEGAAKQRAIP